MELKHLRDKPEHETSPMASIVVTTRNRRDDVCRAVASSLSQDYPSLEVIVFDDASNDGTCTTLRDKFPQIQVIYFNNRQGYIANRNRAFQKAKGEIVFYIDDDAYFSTPDIVSCTMIIFAQDPKVAAVAIPYVEPFNRRSLSSLRQPSSLKPRQDIRTYTGCAHAVRKQAALSIGGYREFFVHQGEERDFCIRLIESGWRLIYGDSKHIVHTVNPNRESSRVIYYGSRNLVLFSFFNVPSPYFLFRLFWDPLSIIRYRFSISTLPLKLLGIASGFYEGLIRLHARRPVSRSTYVRYRRLPGHGPENWAGPVPKPIGPDKDFSPLTTKVDIGVTRGTRK